MLTVSRVLKVTEIDATALRDFVKWVPNARRPVYSEKLLQGFFEPCQFYEEKIKCINYNAENAAKILGKGTQKYSDKN